MDRVSGERVQFESEDAKIRSMETEGQFTDAKAKLVYYSIVSKNENQFDIIFVQDLIITRVRKKAISHPFNGKWDSFPFLQLR